MNELKNAMQALGVKGHVKVTGINGAMLRVTLDGKYFGLFDSERKLFVD